MLFTTGGPDGYDDMMKKLDRIVEVKERELQRIFLDNDQAASAGLMLMDELYHAVGGHLCNYEKATDHLGKKHDIGHVIECIEILMESGYHRITGKRYCTSLTARDRERSGAVGDRPVS